MPIDHTLRECPLSDETEEWLPHHLDVLVSTPGSAWLTDDDAAESTVTGQEAPHDDDEDRLREEQAAGLPPDGQEKRDDLNDDDDDEGGATDGETTEAGLSPSLAATTLSMPGDSPLWDIANLGSIADFANLFDDLDVDDIIHDVDIIDVIHDNVETNAESVTGNNGKGSAAVPRRPPLRRLRAFILGDEEDLDKEALQGSAVGQGCNEDSDAEAAAGQGCKSVDTVEALQWGSAAGQGRNEDLSASSEFREQSQCQASGSPDVIPHWQPCSECGSAVDQGCNSDSDAEALPAAGQGCNEDSDDTEAWWGSAADQGCSEESDAEALRRSAAGQGCNDDAEARHWQRRVRRRQQ